MSLKLPQRPTSKSNSKASLDNNRPQRHRHLELKLKKRQLDDEQYTKIERENRILMEKMYAIMKVRSLCGDLDCMHGHLLRDVHVSMCTTSR